jgi:hypothetical protein
MGMPWTGQQSLKEAVLRVSPEQDRRALMTWTPFADTSEADIDAVINTAHALAPMQPYQINRAWTHHGCRKKGSYHGRKEPG